MDKDSIGDPRRTPNDKQTTGPGPYGQAAFSAQPAGGSAKDAASMSPAKLADAADKTRHDFEVLREDLAKLTEIVGQLAQSQAASTREQVMDAVGVAKDKIAEGAAATQDKLVSLEADLEAQIRRNPLSSVAIALVIGLLLGKMS